MKKNETAFRNLCDLVIFTTNNWVKEQSLFKKKIHFTLLKLINMLTLITI